MNVDGARLASDVTSFLVSFTTPFSLSHDLESPITCGLYTRSEQPIGLSENSDAMVG